MKFQFKNFFAFIFVGVCILPFPSNSQNSLESEFKLFAKGNTLEIGKDCLFAKPLKKSAIPMVRVKDASGNTYSLQKLVGNNGAIHLWHLHCPPCIAEMASTSKFALRYNAKFGNFIFLSSDTPADFAKSEKKIRKLTGGNYSTYFLDRESQKELFIELFTPQTIFYNSNGVEQTRGLYISSGAKDFDAIAKFLKANDK